MPTEHTPMTLMRIPDDCYEIIRKLVYEQTRINLGDNKRELVQSRLAKRLRLIGFNNYHEYCRFVTHPQGADELEHLINAISTNHTYFFREPQHFEFLTQVALPELFAKKKTPIRIWSSASSSGEEAYTIAIVLSEFFRKNGRDQNPNNWEIECTDISSKILESARQGIYTQDRLREIPPETQSRYFQKGTGKLEGHYRIKSSLRNHFDFHLQNLLKPPYPFDQLFDVIFCRNVMIYFDKATQSELVGYLHKYLNPGGYLMIGHSESLTGINHPYESIKPAIFRKKILS